MQIKHWIVIAGILVAAPMLAACGEEKKAEETAPVTDPAAPADAAPAEGQPAEEKTE